MLRRKQLRLFIPGPVEVSEKTLKAMCQPMIGHRGSDFKELYRELQPGLKSPFRNRETGFPLHILSVGRNGRRDSQSCWSQSSKLHVRRVFGQMVRCQQALRKGGRSSPSQLGRPDPAGDDRGEAFRRRFRCAHAHSQRNILRCPQPARAIAEVMRRFPDVMFIVDAVSSFSAEPIPMDNLGIDVLLTGSQKALALPPGLAFSQYPSVHWSARTQSTERGYYFDFVEFARNAEQDMTPSTPVIPLLYALRSKLDDIAEEGLEARYERHRRLNAMVHRWVQERGFGFFAADGYRSLTLTCVKNNRRVDVGAWIARLRERHQMAIDGGYGKIKGETFRISNMGDETEAIDADPPRSARRQPGTNDCLLHRARKPFLLCWTVALLRSVALERS